MDRACRRRLWPRVQSGQAGTERSDTVLERHSTPGGRAQLDHADPTSVAVPAQVRHSQSTHSAIEPDSSIVWRAGTRLGSSLILQSNEMPGACLSATFRSANIEFAVNSRPRVRIVER